VHPANVQDRDGAPAVVTLACASYPTIAHLFADGGYAGEKLENALRKIDGPTIEIVKRPDDAKGFVMVARRWVIERTLAWLNRCRRLAIGRPPSTRLKHGSLLRQLDNWCAASPDRPMSGHDFCVRL